MQCKAPCVTQSIPALNWWLSLTEKPVDFYMDKSLIRPNKCRRAFRKHRMQVKCVEEHWAKGLVAGHAAADILRPAYLARSS